MADKVTTTSKKAAAEPTTAEKIDRIEAAKEELRNALVDAGQDPGTIDAQMYALRLPEDSVVGNLADLQRLGALVAKGMSVPAAIEEAVVTSDTPPVEN
jgi:hypothetical protein